MDSAHFFPLPVVAPTPTNPVVGELTDVGDATAFATLVSAPPDAVETPTFLNLPQAVVGIAPRHPGLVTPPPSLPETVITPDSPPVPPKAEEERQANPETANMPPEASSFACIAAAYPVVTAMDQTQAPGQEPPISAQSETPPEDMSPSGSPQAEKPRHLDQRSSDEPAPTLHTGEAAPYAVPKDISALSAPTPVEPTRAEQAVSAASHAIPTRNASSLPLEAPAQPQNAGAGVPAPDSFPATIHHLSQGTAQAAPKQQTEHLPAAKPIRHALETTPADSGPVPPVVPTLLAEGASAPLTTPWAESKPHAVMPRAKTDQPQPKAIVPARSIWIAPDQPNPAPEIATPAAENATIAVAMPLTPPPNAQPPSAHELAFLAKIDPPAAHSLPDAAPNPAPGIQTSPTHAEPQAQSLSHDADTPTGPPIATDSAPSATPQPDVLQIPMPDALSVARTAPPSPPAEKPTASPPAHQAATALAQHLPSQPDRIELTLTPEDLGSLRFDMHRRGHELSIVMSAERPETLDLMRRQLPDLMAELKQAGVQAGTFSFGTWSDRGHGHQPPQSAAFLPQAERDATPPRPQTPPPARPSGNGLDLRL